MKKFFYGSHFIDKKDKIAVLNSLNHSLSQGPILKKFENDVAKMFGAKYCVATSSATAALHITIKALNLKKNSLAYTSDMTFVATTNACLYNNLKINLVDINLDNFNLKIDDLEKKLSKKDKKKKLILPVHFGGLPCNMKKIYKIAKKYNCFVIEDASQAMGAKYYNKYIGSCKFSDAAIFSLHPVKSITSGEGGLVLTNDKNLAEKIKLLRSHGIFKDKKVFWKNNMISLGYNYKITDFQCALGLSQLKKLKTFISKRHKIAKLYIKILSKAGVTFQIPTSSQNYYSAYHYFIILFKKKITEKTQKKFLFNLAKKGIYLGKQYKPVHKHSFYKKIINEKYPNSERYYSQGFQLPLNPNLKNKEINLICNKIIDAIKRFKLK